MGPLPSAPLNQDLTWWAWLAGSSARGCPQIHEDRAITPENSSWAGGGGAPWWEGLHAGRQHEDGEHGAHLVGSSAGETPGPAIASSKPQTLGFHSFI